MQPKLLVAIALCLFLLSRVSSAGLPPSDELVLNDTNIQQSPSEENSSKHAFSEPTGGDNAQCDEPAKQDVARETTAADLSVNILGRENLVAWCIVPFDATRRSPAERATMLKDLGIRRCAYDWREEHVASFEEEILEYRDKQIEFFAFWSVHDRAFDLFKKYDLHPQIWQTLSDPGGDEVNRVDRAAEALVPLAKRTADIGCQLGLYNHGGWGGEPKNMVAVCQRLQELGHRHVGIVYNFHHGHEHIADWRTSLELMLPHLLCVNLDGMNPGANPKILGIGKGQHELEMVRQLVESGYQGPVGIIDHRDELDAKDSLLENLEGLEWLSRELSEPGSGGDLPPTPQPPVAQPAAGDTPPLALDDSLAYSASLVQRIVRQSLERGDADRGAAVFASGQTTCLACHGLAGSAEQNPTVKNPAAANLGGNVGPKLPDLLTSRSAEHIVESLLWPGREIQPEFRLWRALTDDGEVISGYVREDNEQHLVLHELSSNRQVTLAKADIEEFSRGGTPMPAGLLASITGQQRLDLIRFLCSLRDGQALSNSQRHAIANASSHAPVDFPLEREPLSPERWPNHMEKVNHARLYDFYTKQAEYFRTADSVPLLIGPFPGLDGGKQGHWGNQNEVVWTDDRWNQTQLGSVQSGVFHAPGRTIARGICLRLGEDGELSACFDPDTLTYVALWKNGFVGFSDVRHGFMHGLQMQGDELTGHELLNLGPPGLDGQPANIGGEASEQATAPKPSAAGNEYLGFYRLGKRVVFHYRVGDQEFLDAPSVVNGKFHRELARLEEHSLRDAIRAGGVAQWPETIPTSILPGKTGPFVVDQIELPFDNPWKALVFPSGHDFLPDGSGLVCTMQGDVWRVRGLESGTGNPGEAIWQRFAAGLHFPLGLVVSDGQVFVQCRDQLMRLSDLNGDGEADYYECYSKAFETSPAGHDYICGLQRDPAGNFYTASGNQGLLRISSDGKRADVLAVGFRNPDGLGYLPDGWLTVPCSEGGWTPASMICAVRAEFHPEQRPPHFGFGGPRDGQPPSLPLVYLPRGIDNSSGGQAVVPKGAWGALSEQLLHFSFGAGTWFVVLRDEVNGVQQAAVVPMAGDFRSGAHRGRFNPNDQQLYVSGMAGWGSYTPDDGCFQRVRMVAEDFQSPVGFHAYRNGLRVTFSQPVDSGIASQPSQHFAQGWNYRYTGGYGSLEYSPTHRGVPGHDPLAITACHVSEDRHSLFLEIPDLQPVNQLHLRLHVNEPVAESRMSVSPSGTGHDLFVTVHQLGDDYQDYPDYRRIAKTIAAHPMLVDLASTAEQPVNPWSKRIAIAERTVEIRTGQNLTYQVREIRAAAGEPIELKLINTDVVPHNWVLIKPGTLEQVGEQANRLIADPAAYLRQYIPQSEDVLTYTDVVSGGAQQSIHFTAPQTPGRYPYLCTFPGHWMVMNGTLVVE